MNTAFPTIRTALAILVAATTCPGQFTPDFHVVALQGNPTPSISPVATYGILGSLPHIDATGHVSFGGFVGNNGSANYAVWSGIPGNTPALAVLIRKGTPIPILPGFTWDLIGKPRINNRGDIAFEAVPKPAGNKSFFVRLANGSLFKVAEDGQPAPGTDGRAWSGSFFNQPLIAGSFCAFKAGLEEHASNGRDGIWIFDPHEGTKLVAKADDPAPALAAETFDTFDAPSLNALGMVAFKALTHSRTQGLWLYHQGVVRLLVAVGDLLPVGPGDIRRVAAIGFQGGSSSQSGYRSALNDAGQIVFKTSFNTGALGTAVFHAELWDHDGGGVSSILEDGFGGDPHSNTDDSAILPGIRTEGGEVVVTYRRRSDGSFFYEVQSSSNLTGWEQAAGSTALASDQTGIPAGIERVEFRTAIVAGSARSFRVRVTRL
jgi:hypothetical protein